MPDGALDVLQLVEPEQTYAETAKVCALVALQWHPGGGLLGGLRLALLDDLGFLLAVLLRGGVGVRGGGLLVRPRLLCLLYTSPSPPDRPRSPIPAFG